MGKNIWKSNFYQLPGLCQVKIVMKSLKDYISMKTSADNVFSKSLFELCLL